MTGLAQPESSFYIARMIAKLRELWNARPFAPFAVHLADGRILKIPHPDFFYISPSGGRIFVVDAEENYHYLNPLVIVSVTESQMGSQVSS